MSSMYEQAYNQYLKMEGSSFVSPEKPKSLGGRPDVKVADAQISKIGATNIAIYERFSAIRKENKRLKEQNFLKMKASSGKDQPINTRPDLEKEFSESDEYNTERANRYFKDLKSEFPNLTKKQLSAIVGNLHHESRGFTAFKETGGRGLGDAQWTATRRKEFLDFTKENNLDPKTYEGSYAFLIHELKNNRTHGFTEDFMEKFNNQDLNISQLTKMFERQYLVAGEPKMQSRIADANFYFNREDL